MRLREEGEDEGERIVERERARKERRRSIEDYLSTSTKLDLNEIERGKAKDVIDNCLKGGLVAAGVVELGSFMVCIWWIVVIIVVVILIVIVGVVG
jgi:hypothetical protein